MPIMKTHQLQQAEQHFSTIDMVEKTEKTHIHLINSYQLIIASWIEHYKKFNVSGS